MEQPEHRADMDSAVVQCGRGGSCRAFPGKDSWNRSHIWPQTRPQLCSCGCWVCPGAGGAGRGQHIPLENTQGARLTFSHPLTKGRIFFSPNPGAAAVWEGCGEHRECHQGRVSPWSSRWECPSTGGNCKTHQTVVPLKICGEDERP